MNLKPFMDSNNFFNCDLTTGLAISKCLRASNPSRTLISYDFAWFLRALFSSFILGAGIGFLTAHFPVLGDGIGLGLAHLPILGGTFGLWLLLITSFLGSLFVGIGLGLAHICSSI